LGSLRIAFVHNRCPAYRRRFFELLAQKFEVDYFFVNERGTDLPPNSVVLKGYRIPKASDYEMVPKLLPALMQASKARKYDIYVCTDLGYFITHITYLVARTNNKPFVLWNGQWMEIAHPRRWAMRPLENRIIRYAASIVAYGSKAKEFLVRRGAEPEKIFIAYNSSDYRYSLPSNSILATFFKKTKIQGKKVVLFLGRLVKFKGVDVLIQAFAKVSEKLPDAFLIIAGTGPELGRLRKLIVKMGLEDKVWLPGEIKTPLEKDLLFTVAHVFVLPSRYLRTPEPWGLVLNEAATAGLPLIATDMVGATYDLLIDGECGLVVPAGSVVVLQHAIEWVLTHPEQARQMGKLAQDIVSNFTPENMVKVFSNAFEIAWRE